MEKLQLKNFRSIIDSGEIDIKPLTVLLGKNSCGKSSFIRMFPLIKQSLEVDIQEPILWFGNYVDFGDYDNIIPKNKSKDSDAFKMAFELNLLPQGKFYYGDFRSFQYARFIDKKEALDKLTVHVEIEFKQRNISSLELKFFDQIFYCEFNENNKLGKCIINGFENIEGLENYKLLKSKGDFLPNIIYQPKEKIDKYISFYHVQEVAFLPIAKIFEEEVKTKSQKKTIIDFIIKGIWIQSKSKLLEYLKGSKTQIAIKNYFADKDITDNIFCKINNQMVLSIIPALIGAINTNLDDLFYNTFYIKPLRASANRYYRVQGLNTKNVDPDGSNLPMVLYNMSEDMQKHFSNWCNKQLGLMFSLKKQEGHVSLMVKTDDNYEVNLTDTGYGYSQMLPILLQLWLLMEKNSTKATPFCTEYRIIIEQPELHLHPAFQSKLIDVFVSLVKSINESGNKIKIIFETHSEVMINRIGTLISRKTIKRDDVNIVLVSKENDVSSFHQTNFDDNGFINKWPVGFMSPED